VTRSGIQNRSFGLLGSDGHLDATGFVFDIFGKVFILHVVGELSSQESELHGGVRGMAR
tara:strand:- start:383 stop:559 length:177 start_codon:yes stop_codon:yes gene_type:complete